MSENYQVSARKYRPQTFDTVVGQSHITTTLKNAIRHQQLAHAFLFCGPRGVGKTTCARILAKTINCTNPTADMEACGTCPSCVGFKNNTLFNIFELDAASNNSVEDIRELTSQVRFAPQQGKYKVYIIDEVHMLSSSAFNAFLKTLEEPPPYAIFILATTEKHKILPTILSRCQIFDFKRITTNDIVAHLAGIVAKEGLQAEEAALHIIAQKSEGCMRDALSMLDRIAGFTDGVLSYLNTMEHLNLLDADFYFGLTDKLLCQDVAGALLDFDKVLEKGFEGDTILSGLAEHLRNLLLCKDKRMARLLDVPNDHKPIFYEKANQMPPSYIISSLALINDCELEYKNANNKRLHIEICIIRLCYVLQATKAHFSYEADDEKKNFSRVEEPEIMPGKPVEKNSQPVPAALKRSDPQPALVSSNPQPVVRENAFTTVPNNNTISAENQPVRKISKNLFANIEQAVSQATSSNGGEKKAITEELARKVMDDYMNKMQQSGQSVLFSQFKMMRLELLPPDEVKIIAPTEFNENYAKAERNAIIEYYKAATGLNIRITTAVVEEQSAADANQPRILSKAELFEVMLRKNPNLGLLKDGLNLQLEY